MRWRKARAGSKRQIEDTERGRSLSGPVPRVGDLDSSPAPSLRPAPVASHLCSAPKAIAGGGRGK